MKNPECIFCKIVAGEIPSKFIWESDTHAAFLDINPLSKGMTLVVPKKHTPSDVLKLENTVITEIMDAAREVAEILDEKLEGNMRTTLLFEGIDVDHLHAKLIPLYKEDLGKHQPIDMSLEELQELSDFLAN